MSTNMSDQKFCIDCKHFRWGSGVGAEFCSRPVSDQLDPVWGCAWEIDKRPPTKIRKDLAACGPAAVFFEPKPVVHSSYADQIEKKKAEELEQLSEAKQASARKWWKFWL